MFPHQSPTPRPGQLFPPECRGQSRGKPAFGDCVSPVPSNLDSDISEEVRRTNCPTPGWACLCPPDGTMYSPVNIWGHNFTKSAANTVSPTAGENVPPSPPALPVHTHTRHPQGREGHGASPSADASPGVAWCSGAEGLRWGQAEDDSPNSTPGTDKGFLPSLRCQGRARVTCYHFRNLLPFHQWRPR